MRLYLSVMVVAVIQSRTAKADAADSKALLQKIAATYEEILDYSVEVETRVESASPDSPATKTRYLLASSRPKKLFTEERVSSPIRYDVRLGMDGNSQWGYTPTTRSYVLESAADASSNLEEELLRQHFRLFRKFEKLDRSVVAAEIGRPQTVSDGERRIRCIVVRLRSIPERDWTEQLWVDQERYLVLKSVFQKRILFDTVTTTTTWRKFRINADLDPMIFRFAVPSTAKRTNQIQIP